MASSSLEPFFNPASIAVIGASRDSGKPGRAILKNLMGHYKGKLYPVNPKVPEIDGLKCYPGVLEIPGTIELAVISVPAPLVPQVLEECGKKKVKCAIVISGGFSEMGNHDLEKTVVDTAKKHGIRIVGPNCLGILDVHAGANMMFLPTFRVPIPKPGPVAFVSQSGAVCATGLDMAAADGIGISKMVSYGNKVDVDEVEMLKYLENDDNTRVIMLYVESIKRGREFIEVASRVSRKKPIVAFKAGKSSSGARAVASHTGSLAGDAKIYEIAFKKAGIIEATSMEEMLDFAKAFAMQPPAKGNRIMVVTSGGGFGVMATDAIEQEGMTMASLRPEVIADLKSKMPAHVVIKNPIDITGDADSERYRLSMEAVLEEKGVDAVALLLFFQLPRISDEIIPMVEDLLVKGRGKPIVGVSAGSEFSVVHYRRIEEFGLPMYPTPERAIKALGALVRYGKTLKNPK